MTHEYFMQQALNIAKNAYVSPNPKVGAVIVQNTQIIAQGFHEKYGQNHAEINALNNISSNTPLENAILYVTLEPCSHYGKTPPCTDRIIASNISTVIIGCLDPNPLVAGKGVEKLRDAGITVITGILEDQAKKMNETFFKYITTRQPFVLMKGAMTLDGKIATNTGESQWISSEEARLEVQKIRAQMTAIMVGINTVLLDDPMLTCRLENHRSPIRIIVDSSLKTPLNSKIVQTADQIPTIIATINQNTSDHEKFIKKGIEIIVCDRRSNKINLNDLMLKLGQKEIDSILLEGGSNLFNAALEAQIVDKIQLYIAPKIFGGVNTFPLIGGLGINSIKDALSVQFSDVYFIGKDIAIEAYIQNKDTKIKDNLCLPEL